MDEQGTIAELYQRAYDSGQATEYERLRQAIWLETMWEWKGGDGE